MVFYSCRTTNETYTRENTSIVIHDIYKHRKQIWLLYMAGSRKNRHMLTLNICVNMKWVGSRKWCVVTPSWSLYCIRLDTYRASPTHHVRLHLLNVDTVKKL